MRRRSASQKLNRPPRLRLFAPLGNPDSIPTETALKIAKFEHLGQSLGEALPTFARIDDLVGHLEPRDTTMLRVLETKATAGETAISVT